MTHQSNRFRFEHALRFAAFLERAQKHAQLWRDTYRLTKVSDDMVARAAAVPGRWHLLVMVEDWCGDAVNTLPHLARLAERAPNLDLRVVGRDDNPELMDAHLTDGSRSIPVVMLLDAAFVEHAWWGPRPGELQRWVMSVGRTLEKDERYRHVRTWYARDRGRTTLDEVVSLLETASERTAAA